jgi:uncharacterized protein YjbI with pentapeptide repeats
MTVYYVDDGGSSTSPYDTWAKAATSINTLDAAIAFASGDIVYFGHDHNCAAVNAASLTITGPGSGLPVIFISATTGSDPPAYQKGTGTQIDTTEGATFDISFSGGFSLYGIHAKAGEHIFLYGASNRTFYTNDCTFAPGPTGGINFGGAATSGLVLKNTVVDLTQDGSTPRTTYLFAANFSVSATLDGLSFINAGFRTGVLFATDQFSKIDVSGADFSGFNNATTCELSDTNFCQLALTNCKTVSSFALVPSSGSPTSGTIVMATNCGPADDPPALKLHNYHGDIVSSTTIYRSSGATVEGINTSWLVTTTANCNEYAPFHSPWMPSRVASAGTKNFDVFISNDTADFLDSEVWIELERRTTVGSPLWTLASDQRATITTTPVAQDDDTTSTWNGAGPAFTFKQRLRVTAAVEPGQYRVRVVTGVASIASSRNFYVDPDVTVT